MTLWSGNWFEAAPGLVHMRTVRKFQFRRHPTRSWPRFAPDFPPGSTLRVIMPCKTFGRWSAPTPRFGCSVVPPCLCYMSREGPQMPIQSKTLCSGMWREALQSLRGREGRFRCRRPAILGRTMSLHQMATSSRRFLASIDNFALFNLAGVSSAVVCFSILGKAKP